MNCSHCSTRNSPAALVCHHCGAEFEVVSAADEIGPRRRWVSWLIACFAVLLLMVAMDRLGLVAGRWVQDNPNSVTYDKNGLLQRYAAWKAAHGQSTATMLSFYAPEARIIQTLDPRRSNTTMTVAELGQECDHVRLNKTIDSVTDLLPPQLQTNGGQIIITAQHRYSDYKGGPGHSGDRRLIWENRDGQWLIVEDDFPHSYTPVP